ncbi:MAG: LPS export ABC transporter permease LptF [Burkholderiaceae bacterium]
MIFHSSFKRDLNGVAGVMFATLFTIMVTTTLTRFLGRAADDRINSTDVLPLIAFTSIGFIPVLLVLTVFLSILVVLSRSWRDSEMVVWFASGQSLTALLRPVFGFVAPYALVVALVTMLVSPWANRQIDELRRAFEQREDVSQVAPGVFRESRSANRVFFVETVDREQTEVSNVFVVQKDGERVIVVASLGGRVQLEPNGDRFLVLERGRRYDGRWTHVDYSLMEFERYAVRIENPLGDSRAPASAGLGTLDLIAEPTQANLAELAARVATPMSMLVVALLAIPLAFVNPRIGSSLNLVIGLLIYFTYTNVNGLVKAWIAQGRMPFSVGLWITHAIVLLIAIHLFRKRVALPRLSLGRLLAWLFARRRTDDA